MTRRFYSGIGSRKTPPDVLDLMRKLAYSLALQGWTLRTGHADGADQAFERGAFDAARAATLTCAETAEVYLPWETYNLDRFHPAPCELFPQPYAWAYEVAERHHPAWERCSRGARALHARNVHIVAGPGNEAADVHEDPSSLVVCWHQGSGGTMQAVRIAQAAGIPVRNLADPATRRRAEDWLRIIATEDSMALEKARSRCINADEQRELNRDWIPAVQLEVTP